MTDDPSSQPRLVRGTSPSGIPYVDFGGQGPTLHFAHGNGFPPATYSHFLEQLTDGFHVVGMECRALWGTEDPKRFRHWRELGQDLARFLVEMNLQGVVAAGHSLGAVTSVLCAVAHPDLIRALVLIDPVILPAWFAPLWATAMLLRLNRLTPLPASARRRRLEWPSKGILLRAYGSARVFERWQEPFAHDYVEAVTVPTPSGGVRLRYPPEWEARIFETVPADVWCILGRLRTWPLLVLRGQRSDTYRREAMRLMRWLLPQARFVEIEGADHFVPMTQPRRTADQVRAFVRQVLPQLA